MTESETETPASPTSEIVTLLPDLTELSLGDLRTFKGADKAVERIWEQIKRPRSNLGNSGPPGRAD